MDFKNDSNDRDNRASQKETDAAKIETYRRASLEKEYGTKVFSLIERSWAAGLFDGEGHASAGKNNGHFSCTIEQSLINKEVLERFKAAVGAGKILERKHRKRGNEKPTCQWAVTNQKDLAIVAGKIGKFLSKAKQDQLARALSVPVRTLLEKDCPLPGNFTAVEPLSKKRATRSKDSAN